MQITIAHCAHSHLNTSVESRAQIPCSIWVVRDVRVELQGLGAAWIGAVDSKGEALEVKEDSEGPRGADGGER